MRQSHVDDDAGRQPSRGQFVYPYPSRTRLHLGLILTLKVRCIVRLLDFDAPQKSEKNR